MAKLIGHTSYYLTYFVGTLVISTEEFEYLNFPAFYKLLLIQLEFKLFDCESVRTFSRLRTIVFYLIITHLVTSSS